VASERVLLCSISAFPPNVHSCAVLAWTLCWHQCRSLGLIYPFYPSQSAFRAAACVVCSSPCRNQTWRLSICRGCLCMHMTNGSLLAWQYCCWMC
jgi:hypothetical protein